MHTMLVGIPFLHHLKYDGNWQLTCCAGSWLVCVWWCVAGVVGLVEIDDVPYVCMCSMWHLGVLPLVTKLLPLPLLCHRQSCHFMSDNIHTTCDTYTRHIAQGNLTTHVQCASGAWTLTSCGTRWYWKYCGMGESRHAPFSPYWSEHSVTHATKWSYAGLTASRSSSVKLTLDQGGEGTDQLLVMFCHTVCMRSWGDGPTFSPKPQKQSHLFLLFADSAVSSHTAERH